MNPIKFLDMAKAVKENYEAKHGNSDEAKKLNAGVGILKEMFDPSFKGPRVPFKELMTANDFPILFSRVVTDQLQQPVEPQYLGISTFSRTINVGPAQTLKFPMVGAVTADDIPLGQPIPRRDLTISMQMVTFDSSRSGVAFDIDPDLLNDSMYNLLSFFTEAGRRALLRWKEEKVWNYVRDNAHVIFDNESSDSRGWTSGRGEDGVTRNGSMAYDDFIEMIAQMMQNEYEGTDILLNPMGWAIFHKDPIMRAQWMNGGQIGANIWSKSPELVPQSITPFGLSYHATRFMEVDLEKVRTICGVTGTSGNYLDILMVDRNNPLLILQREGITLDQWQVHETDISTIAMKERYAIYGVDGNRSSVIAKSVRLATNHQPVATVTTVIP